MAEPAVLRLAGTCALLSMACVVATIAIAISAGPGGAPVLEFGDAEAVRALAAAGAVPPLLSLLALISPTISLPAGIGWYRWLAPKGGLLLPGVVLWYLGMVFVIWQDALEYVLVANLPTAFVAAGGAEAAALLAAGDLLGRSITVFTILGDLVSFFGIVLVNISVWRLGGRWRLAAAAGMAGGVLICAGLLVPALAAVRLPGFLLFVAWMTITGIAMLRHHGAAQPAP